MTNLPTDCIETLPVDCIHVVSEFLSHKDANSYLQTSKMDMMILETLCRDVKRIILKKK